MKKLKSHLAINYSCTTAVVFTAGLLLSATFAQADQAHDIGASANAFVLRSAAGTDQGESTTITTKRLNDSNARIGYLRFDLSSFLSSFTPDDIIAVSLRLNYKSTVAETIRGYGLLETNLNGVADSVWTGVMTWNDQPARTAAPNDIPSSAAALPNGNTTPLFFSQAIPAASGVIEFTISLTEFKALLAADNNQQVTLLFHNTGNNNCNWSSLTDGANPPPTLRLTTLSAPPTQADIVWRGTNSNFGVNGDWDTFTSNWRTNGTETAYADGLIVQFDDTAISNAVNVTTTVSPGGILITNDALDFVFGGFGAISGPGGLFKYGAGTVVLDNSGLNDFNGTIIIAAGTVQVGNNDTAGNLGSGTVVNDGALVFSRTDDQTVANNILGSGSLAKTTTGVLTLGGGSAYDGVTTVAAGTLRVDNNSALGSVNGGTIIAAGATLDVGGPSLGVNALTISEPITVGGAGVNGLGAIVNNAAVSQLNALKYVTLTDDTVVGGVARWDLRAAGGTTGNPAGASLSTGGQPYSLTKTGLFEVNIVSATVDPMLADIDILEGVLGLEGNTTSAGNPADTLTIHPNATLRLWALTNQLNKNIVVADTGIILNGSGANTVVGPMTLNGGANFNIGGVSLTLSNNISGAGGIAKSGVGTLTLAGAATHTGGTTANAGTVALTGTHTSGLTNAFGTVLRGSGTNTGPTEVAGTFLPGATNVAGTFNSGPMNFTGTGALVFDLTNSATIGGGVNDLIQVTGDVTANFDAITINVLGGKLQTATPYRLVNYSGSYLGAGFNTFINPIGRYQFTLDTSTANQINLTVVGGPQSLRWISTLDNTWSELGAFNWTSNSVGSTPADSFYAADSVLFDDTPGVVTNIAITANVAPTAVTVNANANEYAFTGSAGIVGATGLTKNGTAMLTLATPNTFSGPVTVNAGILKIGDAVGLNTVLTALGSTTTGTVIASGATLDVNGYDLGAEPITVSGAGVGGLGAIVENTGDPAFHNPGPNLANVTLAGDTTFGGTGRLDIRSTPSTGTNAVLLTGGQPYKLTKVGTNQMNLTGVQVDPALGDIDIQAGILGLETATTFGNANSNLVIHAGATLLFYRISNPLDRQIQIFGDGTTASIYAQNSQNNDQNVVTGPMQLNNECWMDVGSGFVMTFSNVISGSGDLTKVGAGTLRMASVNNYSGDTTVNAGTLALLGATTLDTSSVITVGAGATLDVSGAGGTLTLVSGQTLQGNGTVAGIVTAGNGSTLAPGTSVGQLAASSVINLDAGSVTAMELDAAAGTNDVLTSSSAILYGGTLAVTNIAGTLTAGQSFKLFDAPLLTQNFAVTNLPALGSGLVWEWTPATGTLSVVATVNTNPTNITSVVSGGQITLSWPTDHTGWRLEAQTNALNVGLSSSWSTVSGSATTNEITLDIDPANGAVFFRLVYP